MSMTTVRLIKRSLFNMDPRIIRKENVSLLKIHQQHNEFQKRKQFEIMYIFFCLRQKSLQFSFSSFFLFFYMYYIFVKISQFVPY